MGTSCVDLLKPDLSLLSIFWAVSIYLSISVYMSVHAFCAISGLHICLSIYFLGCINRSLSKYIYLSVYNWLFIYVNMFAYLTVCLYLSVYICTYLHSMNKLVSLTLLLWALSFRRFALHYITIHMSLSLCCCV